MLKKIHLYSLAVMLMGLAEYASAKTVEKVESYGVYVVAKKGFVRVKPYQHKGSRVDFSYLNEIPWVERNSEQLKLIVHTNEFKQSNFIFKTRSLSVDTYLEDVSFSVKPLKEKGMYEFTFDQKVKDGTILQMAALDVLGYLNMGVIVLGDTERELVSYFNNKELKETHSVAKLLKDSLLAFPENDKLKEMLPYWEQASKAKKAKKKFGHIEKSWASYNKATKLSSKKYKLQVMLGDIKRYLREYPDGADVEVVKQRKEIAEKKLEEYKGLL